MGTVVAGKTSPPLEHSPVNKLLGFFLGLVLSFPAGAATHFFDPTVADGGTGSEASPYNQFADATLANNDTILIKAGTTMLGQTLTVTNLSNIVVGIYGGTKRALIDCNNAVDFGIDIEQADEFSFGDIDIRRCRINNVRIDINTSGTVDVYLSDMDASDITVPQGSNFTTGNSIHATGSVGALIGRLNITYTDVTCSNVSGHCWDQRQEVFTRHVRSKCNGAGIGGAYGAHCFTSSPRSQQWTTGWTLDTGSTYYRNRVFSGDQEYALCGRGGTVGDNCLAKQAANDTTLNVGEWTTWANGTGPCVNGAGCVAVNFGIDPNTTSGNFSEVRMARYQNGVTYIDVEAQGAVTSGKVPNGGAEGDGIVCDDLTANCLILSAWSHDNYRMGVQLRQTVGARLYNVLSTNNAGPGILSQASVDTGVYNFTTAFNQIGFRVNTDHEKTMVVRNGVADSNSQNFVIDPQAVAQVTQSNNVSYNTTTANDNFTAASSLQPLWEGGLRPTTWKGFRPKSGSDLCTGGLELLPGVDSFGRRSGPDQYRGAMPCRPTVSFPD